MFPNGISNENKSNAIFFLESANEGDSIDFKVIYKIGVANKCYNFDCHGIEVEQSLAEIKANELAFPLPHQHLFDEAKDFIVDQSLIVFVDVSCLILFYLISISYF